MPLSLSKTDRQQLEAAGFSANTSHVSHEQYGALYEEVYNLTDDNNLPPIALFSSQNPTPAITVLPGDENKVVISKTLLDMPVLNAEEIAALIGYALEQKRKADLDSIVGSKEAYRLPILLLCGVTGGLAGGALASDMNRREFLGTAIGAIAGSSLIGLGGFLVVDLVKHDLSQTDTSLKFDHDLVKTANDKVIAWQEKHPVKQSAQQK